MSRSQSETGAIASGLFPRATGRGTGTWAEQAALVGAAGFVVGTALCGWRLLAEKIDIELPFPPLIAVWLPHFGPGTPVAIAAAAAVVAGGPRFAQRRNWSPPAVAVVGNRDNLDAVTRAGRRVTARRHGPGRGPVRTAVGAALMAAFLFGAGPKGAENEGDRVGDSHAPYRGGGRDRTHRRGRNRRDRLRGR